MESPLSLESNHMLVNGIWCSHIWSFHTLFKELYWTVSDCFVACSWLVYGKFMGNSEARLWPSLWPVFTAYVWTVCCVDMLYCVLIYVDI